ncbi:MULTISPECIES: helix-turn-helix domain-containing protein [Gordonibacter]|uniref:Helix-turn-helix transcriptional regulator n=1 Tax=Gordonibacter faecis TaxID=3047475 RepID=A0ABT7DS48_9ACTN|nr:helix-turn-helix transcriptional regulator [Gordonibacter sp. KGMB12511]MDJ1651423.1 helix-turn-helix transcriptional regulator [Gordonibacter sp. KGMB12511]HIW76015.1 helix-turn-helix transcriptional regulator [Candidatus Gordonibacter avicola]
MGIDQRKILGSSIRRLRDEQGLTQEQLASMIGNGSKQYISAIENGSKNVTIDVLCRIAEAFGIKVKDLIDF